jgi:hypothetical protein
MLLPATPQFRRKRGGPRKASASAPPGPTPLLLVSASYDSAELLLTLVFDRAVNPVGYIQEAFTVYDAMENMQWYMPNGMEQPSPTSVRFSLVAMEPIGGGFIRMDAWTENGIVAVDDGQPWPGVTNLPLPFP